MGGSGGGGSGRPVYSLAELHNLSSSETDRAEYETAINSILQDALTDYNNRDTTAIRQHLNTIEQAISQQIEGAVQLLFGGSIKKWTYVNGLSDVDMLVCLNNTSLANKTPQEVMQYFENSLRRRLPRTEISSGNLAVTVKFSDGHEIQLLPAVKTATGFKISKPGENRWSNVVSPQRFARKLTEVNQRLSGKVVPVIKLVKAMNQKLAQNSRLSGYHIESLAIEAFKSYNGNQSYREMIQHFWQTSQSKVLNPITDSTGQSRHVDDYLGSANSDVRQRVRNSIARINRKLTSADSKNSVETWEESLEP
ncbi:MAG: nucleotidyltransferase [Deltaproteobacteria bacterium]|nr:nucleotidyltransferase [Deltaproteobacteria bacterium]